MGSLSGYAPAIMGIGVAVLGYAAARFIRWKAHRDIRARSAARDGEGNRVILHHAE
jgi:hypothetical protein